MTDTHMQIVQNDPAKQAFEELRREVSLTRAALEGLTAAREKIPDYSVTLGAISETLGAAFGSIQRVEQSPVVRLTLGAMGAELMKASVAVRAEDARCSTTLAMRCHARSAMSMPSSRVGRRLTGSGSACSRRQVAARWRRRC